MSSRPLLIPIAPLIGCLLLGCGDGGDGGEDGTTLLTTATTSATASASDATSDSTASEASSSPTDATASDSTTTDSTASDSTATDSTDSDSTDSTDTGEDPIPLCVYPCSTVSDCVQPGATGAYDADNYACEAGKCQYTGCNSDGECAELGNFVCYQGSDSPPYCQVGCSTSADCGSAGSPAYDADNYTCEGGACVYQGCTSDAECDMSTAGTGCRDFGQGVSACVTTCSVPADCSVGQLAYDEDNYDCVDGYCDYLGCNSDAECMEFANLVCG